MKYHIYITIQFENPKLLEPEFVIDEDGVVMNKWPDGILRECAVDRFYTINMKEDIEVYDMELKSCEFCLNCQMIPPCTTLAVRIAAPKKGRGNRRAAFREI